MIKIISKIATICLVLIGAKGAYFAQPGNMQILGPQNVCLRECYIYRLSPSPSTNIFWEVLNAQGNPIVFTELDQGQAIRVCFGIADVYTIRASVAGSVITTQITAGNYIDIPLELRAAGCPAQPIIECAEVCTGSIFTIAINQSTPENTQWDYASMTGFDLLDINLNSITFKAPEATGTSYFLGLSGSVSGQCQFEKGICILVNPPPKASYSSNYKAEKDTIKLCAGQELTLRNTSESISHQWILHSNTVVADQTLKLKFDEAGIFPIKLIAYNQDCNCMDEANIYLLVDHSPGANVYCPGTTCAMDTVNYFSDADCAPYLWSISGQGQIIAGGSPSDEFIRVLWMQSGVGQVYLQNSCSDQCPNPTAVDIPIIGADNAIQGPQKVCVGQLYRFLTDPMGGTDFDWEIQGPAIIRSDLKSSAVLIEFFDHNSPNVSIILNYYHCHLDCGGSDTLMVDIVSVFDIAGPTQFCEGSTGRWHAFATTSLMTPADVQWEVYNEQGILVELTQTISSSFEWPSHLASGNYRLVARDISNNYCNRTEMIQIRSIPKPEEPSSIQSEEQFCPGQMMIFKAEPPLSGELLYRWDLIQHNDTLTYLGNEWAIPLDQKADYLISLRKIDANSTCSSEKIEKIIRPIDTLRLKVEGSACIFGESFLELDLAPTAQVSWTISDSDKVNILQYPQQNAIRLRWLQSGSVNIEAEYCGLAYTYEANINPIFEPEVNFRSEVCNGELQLATSVLPWFSYRWLKEGVLVCETQQCEIGPGKYSLEVRDSLGCLGVIFFEVKDLPIPGISIFAPLGIGLCPGDSLLLTSTRYASEDYTYTWYFNGNPLPDTAHWLHIRQLGSYFRIIEDNTTGCTASSNPIVICEHCRPDRVCLTCPCEGEGPIINPGFTVPLVLDTLSCTAYEITAMPPGPSNPDSIIWTIISPNGDKIMHFGNSVRLLLDKIGVYTIFSRTYFTRPDGNIEIYISDIYYLLNDAQADFDFSPACAGQEVLFKDLSQTVAPKNITSYSWEFGDPVFSTSNLENPTMTFPSPGIFDARLTITTDDNCEYSISKTLEVLSPFPYELAFEKEICPDTFATISILGSGISAQKWYFDLSHYPDGFSGVDNPLRLGDPTGGVFHFWLEIVDIQGCIQWLSDSLEVRSAPFPGNILTDLTTPVCEGDSIRLSLSESYASYQWNDGSTAESVYATRSGQYRVIVTDDAGCQGQSELLDLNFFNKPIGLVRMTSATTTVFAPDTLNICFGTEAHVEVLGASPDIMYSWSSGSEESALYFNQGGSFLAEGIHDFSVTLTNPYTGCATILNPITIRVIPSPETPLLNVQPEAPRCSPIVTSMVIINPDPAMEYLWNQGDRATQLTVNSPGRYYVSATSQYGCSSTSEVIEIFGPPTFDFLPDGCFEACKADTLCLPRRTGFQFREWFRDGVLMDPPPIDLSRPILRLSGTYHAEIITDEGCVYQTPSFDFTIYPGLGGIGGLVFEDTDADSIYTSVDRLLSNVRVILIQGTTMDTLYTNERGYFYKTRVPLGSYRILIDSTGLPDSLFLIDLDIRVEITSCHEEVLDIGLPVVRCESDTTFHFFELCYGDSLFIDGQTIVPLEDTLIVSVRLEGACRKFERYEIKVFDEIPENRSSIQLCAGDSISIGGQTYYSDTLIILRLQSVHGCDSIWIFDLNFTPWQFEEVSLRFCEGSSVNYRGIEISKDTLISLRVQGIMGDCDTIIRVEASPYPTNWPTVETKDPCPGANDGSIRLSGGNLIQVVLDGVPMGNLRNFENLAPGLYQIALTDLNECEFGLQIDLIEKDSLLAEITPLQLRCLEEGQLTIRINSGLDSTLQIKWQGGETTSSITVTRPGVYHATVSNKCQTLQLRSQVIGLDDNAGKPYFVPNAFTPNQDEINETLQVFWHPDVEIISFSFEIFDRWGNRQYKSEDPKGGWDGLRSTRNEKVATYVWKLNATVHHCGQKLDISDKGDVTLFR